MPEIEPVSNELSPALAAAVDAAVERALRRVLAERTVGADDETITTEQVRAEFNVSRPTVNRAVSAGRLKPAGYAGRSPRYRRGDVRAWLAAGRR